MPFVWAILSPRRMAVALVLVARDELPNLVDECAAEAWYRIWLLWPWRTRIIERIPGVPEFIRAIYAAEGISDEEIEARFVRRV